MLWQIKKEKKGVGTCFQRLGVAVHIWDPALLWRRSSRAHKFQSSLGYIHSKMGEKAERQEVSSNNPCGPVKCATYLLVQSQGSTGEIGQGYPINQHFNRLTESRAEDMAGGRAVAGHMQNLVFRLVKRRNRVKSTLKTGKK